MRIPRKFGERTRTFKEAQYEKRKYILAYEGQATEVQYFQGVIDNRSKIGIDPIIDLLPALRSIPQESYSHPIKILELIEAHIENYDSVKMLIDKFIDYCSEKHIISGNGVYNIKKLERDLYRYIEKHLHLSPEDKIPDKSYVITRLIKYIKNKLDLTNQLEHIIDYINDQKILFIKDWDYICLIVDRDKGSVNEDQYLELVNKCREMKIRLFVTNPTFEFWLLLHSDKVFEYSRDILLMNEKTGKKRYLEKVLSDVFDSYQKGDIQVQRFIPHIGTAIANEKSFCEDIAGLKDKLGSNIGLLLDEIMADNKKTSHLR